MARPLKRGLAFWRKDVDFYSDPKVRKLMRREGAAAATILDCIFCKIYHEGWFLKIDEDIIEDISTETFTSSDLVLRVIELSVQIGFFHEGFYRNDSVLTGLTLQSKYVSATLRRQKPDSDLQYWLPNGITADNNPVNDCNNGDIVNNNSENNIIQDNNILYSSSCSSIVDKEKEEIFLIFYLKNVKDFRGEFHRFVAYYASRNWKTGEGEQIRNILDVAQAWDPHDADRRLSDTGLALMAQIASKLRLHNVPISERKFLLDVEALYFEPSKITIQCSENSREFLESHIDIIAPVVRQYAPMVTYMVRTQS